MMIKALGTLTDNMNLQYIRTLLCVEALSQFDTSCVKVLSTNTTHLNQVILGLDTYFFPVNVMSNKNCVIRHKTSTP